MEVKPRNVVLVLLVFGILLGGIFRFGAAERAQQGPSLLRVNQQGDLYVVFNEKLFRLYADGSHAETHDLQELGVGELIGGIAFFRNGDLLLRSGDSTPNWYEQLLVQLRMRQPEQRMGTPGDRLTRCNLATLVCVPLKGFEQTFKRTFRVDIDAADNIFIADTGREALYWLDPDGYRLSEVGSGFRLPNQLTRDGDRIVVTNTNRNELTFIPLAKGNFAPAGDWSHVKVNVPEAKKTGEIWPMDLLKVGSDWLVLSQGHNMMFGDVFRFAEDGRYEAKFNLPDEVDPLGLAMLGEEVVVTDYAGLRLLRFSENGEARGELIVPEIASYAESVRAARAHYARLQILLWAVFAGALVFGFAVAINGELKRQRESSAAQSAERVQGASFSESERPAPDDPDIHWVPLSKAFLRQLKLLYLVMTVIPLGGLLLFIPFLDKLTEKSGSGLLIAGLCAILITFTFVLVLVFRKTMRNIGVGVVREWVLLRSASNKVAVGRGAEIGIAANAIIIGAVSVPTGGRKMSTFEPEEWAEWVEPRLIHARKFTAFDMIRWSWKHQRAINLVGIGVAVLLLAALPWLN
jgi:hypothetical protein